MLRHINYYQSAVLFWHAEAQYLEGRTFEALEGLENLDERRGRQLLVVLGRDLHAHLQVLADVGLKHGFDALQ